jgi:hypothetical protein
MLRRKESIANLGTGIAAIPRDLCHLARSFISGLFFDQMTRRQFFVSKDFYFLSLFQLLVFPT